MRVVTGLPRAAMRLLESWAKLPQLSDLYFEVESKAGTDDFFQVLLKILKIDWRISEADVARIPASGPVLAVANHPFGMAEGALLVAFLKEIRPDVRILANSLLSRYPLVAESLIPVDPFGGEQANRANRQGLRKAISWLRNGGMLVTFPAGEVASFHIRRCDVADPPWSPSIARLAMLAEGPVLPMFIEGRNGLSFQAAGLVHPRLRTALLIREFLNKSGKTISVRVGNPVPSRKLASFDSDQERIEYLRRKTYVLAVRQTEFQGSREVSTERAGLPATQILELKPSKPEPVVRLTDVQRMEGEIGKLNSDAILDRQGELLVYIAEANQIPSVVREIGRLREITFRKTGEGTGKLLDLDEFDSHYLHLFLWNAATKEVIGAYRLGQSDLILRNFGISGFYTRKLFAYGRQFMERLNPALEMGRSFVRIEYQRSYAPLLLLWRGIGAYVAKNLQYRTLFGPVSISNDYNPNSRQLMVSFLKEYCRAGDLAKLVRPRSPFRNRPVKGWEVEQGNGIAWDIEELSAFIADIETDQKGVPVLLRQYLKLGGKLVSFNVDSNFSNALDGLIVVDLVKTDPRVLERYMGKSGAEAFLGFHLAVSADLLSGT